MKLEFASVTDVAYFDMSAAPIETFNEIESGIIADYEADGHVVGTENLSVSKCGLPTVVNRVA